MFYVENSLRPRNRFNDRNLNAAVSAGFSIAVVVVVVVVVV